MQLRPSATSNRRRSSGPTERRRTGSTSCLTTSALIDCRKDRTWPRSFARPSSMQTTHRSSPSENGMLVPRTSNVTGSSRPRRMSNRTDMSSSYFSDCVSSDDSTSIVEAHLLSLSSSSSSSHGTKQKRATRRTTTPFYVALTEIVYMMGMGFKLSEMARPLAPACCGIYLGRHTWLRSMTRPFLFLITGSFTTFGSAQRYPPLRTGMARQTPLSEGAKNFNAWLDGRPLSPLCVSLSLSVSLTHTLSLSLPT